MTKLLLSPAIVLLLSIGAAPMHAQSQSSGGTSSDEWKVTMAPYLMLPWMDGQTAVRGRELEVNVAPSEIFSNLQFGVMGAFEARKGKLAVGADAVYMALGTTVDRPPADIDFNQGAYTFTGLRRLNDKADFVYGARSKFARHVWPAVGVDVGKRTTLGMGYRVLSGDYETGSQTNLFKYDVITQAFVLGAAFHF